jgi:hypothetical protein
VRRPPESGRLNRGEDSDLMPNNTNRGECATALSGTITKANEKTMPVKAKHALQFN